MNESIGEVVLTAEDQRVIWELAIGQVRGGTSVPDATKVAKGHFVGQRCLEMLGRAEWEVPGFGTWVAQRDIAGNLRLAPKA